MADETLSAHNARELLAEVERSRESAARLLDSMAQKVGASRPVKAHSVKELAAGVGKVLRSRPAAAVAIAIVAGFLVGRALRSR